MQKFEGQIIRKFDSEDNGNAYNGVAVSVRKSDGTQAQIYATNDINGALLNNPLTSDPDGRYSFYAPNGRYTLSFNNGSSSKEIMMFDAEEFSGGSSIFVDPKTYGVVYGSNLTQEQRVQNSAALNACSAAELAIFITGRIETYGVVRMRNEQNWVGYSRDASAVVGYHPTDNVFEDAAVAGENNNKLQNVTVRQLNIVSNGTGDVLAGTFYTCTIENSKFTTRSENTAAIRFSGKDQMFENMIRHNYFFECYQGIGIADVMTWNPTDQFIVDNSFWCGPDINNPVTDVCINLPSCSGSTFRGNHPYGTSKREFFRLGGLNVSILDNFFEYMRNPRIYLIHGNPSSFTVSGNKFWSLPARDSGLTTDYNGEPSAPIAVTFNGFNPCHSTYSNNLFTGGTNELPIFNIRSGTVSNTNDTFLLFDSSNVVQGSYKLATKNNGATHAKMIVTDHSKFWRWSDERSPNFFTEDFSEWFYTNSGFAESFPVPLPSTTGWLIGKELKINNMSEVTTLIFSANGGATFTGGNRLEPLQTARIVRETNTTYRLITSGGVAGGVSEVDLSYGTVGDAEPTLSAVNPRKLIVDGDYAYAVNAGSLNLAQQGSFQIFDIGNPDGYKILATVNVGSSGAFPSTINVYGNYLYVQARDGTMYVYDIKDKANPSLVNTVNTPSGLRYHSVIHGSHMLIPKSTGSSSIDVLSLADPTNPVVIRRITSALADYRTCFINGTDLWMFKYNTVVDNLVCFSLADVTNPEFLIDTSIASCKLVVDGSVQSNYLYVGGADSADRLTIIDISRNDLVSIKYTAPSDTGKYCTVNGKYLVTENNTYTLTNPILPLINTANPVPFNQHKFVGNTLVTFINGDGTPPVAGDTAPNGKLRCYILNSNDSVGMRVGSVNTRKVFADDVVIRDTFNTNTASVGSGGIGSLGGISSAKTITANTGVANTVYNKTASKRIYGAINTSTDIFKVYGNDLQVFVKIKYALVNDHTLGATAAHTYGEKLLSFYISAGGTVTNRITTTDTLANVSAGTVSVPAFTLVNGDGGNSPVMIRVLCPQLSNANSSSVFEAQVMVDLPQRSIEPA